MTVDPPGCESNALCVAEAPEVFELVDDDDGGRVQILLPTPPAQLEAAVRDAVASCPKQALRILLSEPALRQAQSRFYCR